MNRPYNPKKHCNISKPAHEVNYLLRFDKKGIDCMTDKAQIMTLLQEERKQWEEILTGMTEVQITGSILYDNRSIKDEVAHLWV